MAENFYTIVTKTGLAKITNAQLTSEKLDLATIVVGDGNGAYYNPTSDATAVKKEVWRGAIGSIAVDENNANWIIVETVVPATVGGFTVREIGLLDVAGDLIAIGKYPETYKPVLADGSSKDLYIRMIIEVANTSVVTLKVDPTIVIASRKYVDDKVAASSGAVADVVSGITDGTITILPLTTTDKTLAGAVNEVNAKADGNTNALTTHKAEKATLTKAGHVQLSNSTVSTSESLAATPKSVKEVLDFVKSHGIGTSVGVSNTDLNTYTKTGFYYSYGNAVPNKPPTPSGTGFLIVNNHSLGKPYCSQTFYYYLANQVFTRLLVDGVWGDWKKLMTEEGGDFKGIVKAHPNTSYTVAQVRSIRLGTTEPAAGTIGIGEVYFQYEE